MSSDDGSRSMETLPNAQKIADLTEEENREDPWGLLGILSRGGKLLAREDWLNIATLPRFF